MTDIQEIQNHWELVHKHPRNVSKRFQKDISSRTKDIKQFSQLYMHGRTQGRTWSNLELTTSGGSAKNIHFLLLADSNRLDLSPITSLSPDLLQVVRDPTTLNSSVTPDTIITSLSKYYNVPFTKPPINSDGAIRKPSDHLVVIFELKFKPMSHMQRRYKTVTFRPLPDSKMSIFGLWLRDQNWNEMYKNNDVN